MIFYEKEKSQYDKFKKFLKSKGWKLSDKDGKTGISEMTKDSVTARYQYDGLDGILYFSLVIGKEDDFKKLISSTMHDKSSNLEPDDIFYSYNKDERLTYCYKINDIFENRKGIREKIKTSDPLFSALISVNDSIKNHTSSLNDVDFIVEDDHVDTSDGLYKMFIKVILYTGYTTKELDLDGIDDSLEKEYYTSWEEFLFDNGSNNATGFILRLIAKNNENKSLIFKD